jgi:tetratricopeptide (TPR) repeat protein
MGDRFGVGMALLYLGRVARFYGKTDEARSNLEKSVALFREISNPAHVAWTMVDLGYLELESGRLVEAKEIFTTAIQIASQGRGTMNALTALAGLAAVQARAGAPEQALEWARCVLQHPSTNWETHSRLESLLADLESQPNQPPKASPRARTLEEVLAELTGGLDDRRDEDPRDA